MLEFLLSSTWRIARIVIGIVLIVVGLLVVKGTAGIVLAVIGAVLLVLGLLNVCILAKLLGGGGGSAE